MNGSVEGHCPQQPRNSKILFVIVGLLTVVMTTLSKKVNDNAGGE